MMTTTPSVPSLATASSLIQNYLLKGSISLAEPAHVRARREAKLADEEYREALRELEDMRLGIEQRLERGLGVWEGWERERLRAVKTGQSVGLPSFEGRRGADGAGPR
jgi:hypothetical protein